MSGQGLPGDYLRLGVVFSPRPQLPSEWGGMLQVGKRAGWTQRARCG